MVPWEQFHDLGSKTLLNGVVITAGGDVRSDLQAALDNIFEHRNVGPFFCRLLIQRLVTSNPSANYVRRVAALFDDNGRGVRGDLATVIKAIVLDDEAQSSASQALEFGKLKEPLLRLTHVLRAFGAMPGTRSDGIYHSAARPADRVDEVYGQAVLSSPSVFNFYLPDNPVNSRSTGPGGEVLVAPEQQILTEANVASANNDLHELIYGHHNRSDNDSRTAQINVERALLLVKRNPVFLLDYIDLLLLHGNMSQSLRQQLLDHMENLASNAGFVTPSNTPSNVDPDMTTESDNTNPLVDDETALMQVLDCLYIVVASPSFLVQR